MPPMLDLSDVVTEPYLLDVFVVERRTQSVNDYGETKISVNRMDGVPGIVYPEKPDDLKRRSEAQVNSKTIEIITMFALRGEGKQTDTDGIYQPDYVIWNGDRYIVTAVEDWSNYAMGYVKASAESIDMVDQGPRTRQQAGDGPAENLQ